MYMKIYELKIDDNEELGVFAVSLVDEPAIMVDWVAFSKHQVLFKQEDKMRLTGPVLIPNQQIFRKDPKTGEEYYVTMSADTIDKINLRFNQKGNQNNTTEQHSKELDNSVLIENWVKTSENDKSNDFGFSDLPIGTLFQTRQVTDRKYWNEKVKTGELKGFSIEGLFEHVPMNFKKEKKESNTMKKESLFNRIKNMFFMEAQPEEVQLMDFQLEDGTPIIIDEATGIVSYKDGDNAGKPLPEGDYNLIDGSVIHVDATGTIASVNEPVVAEEVPVEAEADVVPVEEAQTPPTADGKSYILADGTEVKADVDGNIKLKDGEHPLQDGKILVVASGKVTDVKDAPASAPVNAEAEAHNFEAVKTELSKYKSMVDELTEKNAEMTEKNASYKSKLKDANARIKELEDMPGANPINTANVQVETKLSKGTEFLNRLNSLKSKK